MIDFMSKEMPSLPASKFSPECIAFVDLMLDKDPYTRATAAQLLEHPFLTTHSYTQEQSWPYHHDQPMDTRELSLIGDVLIEKCLNIINVEADSGTYAHARLCVCVCGLFEYVNIDVV
jgi:serine/threonine protein kinase